MVAPPRLSSYCTKIYGFCHRAIPKKAHPAHRFRMSIVNNPRELDITLPKPKLNRSSISRSLASIARSKTPTMAETAVTPRAPSAISRPMSEALLNEKWDRCLSNLLVKSTLGLGFGVVFSVLLFKRRAWPAFVGVGFGAGRAYEECNYSLKQAAKDLRKQSS